MHYKGGIQSCENTFPTHPHLSFISQPSAIRMLSLQFDKTDNSKVTKFFLNTKLKEIFNPVLEDFSDIINL